MVVVARQRAVASFGNVSGMWGMVVPGPKNTRDAGVPNPESRLLDFLNHEV